MTEYDYVYDYDCDYEYDHEYNCEYDYDYKYYYEYKYNYEYKCDYECDYEYDYDNENDYKYDCEYWNNNNINLGILEPTTPAVVAPEWIPILIFSLNVGSWEIIIPSEWWDGMKCMNCMYESIRYEVGLWNGIWKGEMKMKMGSSLPEWLWNEFF